MTRLIAGLCLVAAGFSIGKVDDHVRPTMWGWVWELTPKPDFYGSQLVTCFDGSKTLPPWHVYVLYDDQAPLKSLTTNFLQERGR